MMRASHPAVSATFSVKMETARTDGDCCAVELTAKATTPKSSKKRFIVSSSEKP
jgi:hypothetical protein